MPDAECHALPAASNPTSRPSPVAVALGLTINRVAGIPPAVVVRLARRDVLTVCDVLRARDRYLLAIRGVGAIKVARVRTAVAACLRAAARVEGGAA